MKKSTLLRFLFALFAAVAIACAPNPAFAQRGGHGGGGGGSHSGGGGSFHGGGTFGGGGHYSGGGRASSPYRGGGFSGASRSGGSYYGHPGGYGGNHTFYNAGHSYGANRMGARRPGAAPPSNVRFGSSSSFHSFGNRPGSMSVTRGPQNGWHSFGPSSNSSAARGPISRFAGNPHSPSLTAGANRGTASGLAASNSRSWAGQGRSMRAATPRSGSFSGSAISTNHALSSIQSSHPNTLFASNARFGSGAGFHSGFSGLPGSPHAYNPFGYRGFGGIGFRGGGCFGCGFGGGWGWGSGIGFGWGGYWGPGWGGFWSPGWGGYWGYPYGPVYYNPWYLDGGFYSYPTLDYNMMDSNIPGYTSDESGYYDNSSNSQGYDQNAPATQDSGNVNTISPPSSTEGSPDTNAPTDNVAASSPTVLLYLHDGTTITASDYWIENNKIHYTVDYGTAGTISLNDFDLQRTVDENAKRGMTFTLRPNPDTSTAAPETNPDTAPATSTAPQQN